MDIVKSMDESPDIHHIFLKPLQNQHISANSGTLLSTRLYFPNQIDLLAAMLRKYIKDNENSTNYRRSIKRTVESHLINYDYFSSDDFHSYFVDRAKSILKVIEGDGENNCR